MGPGKAEPVIDSHQMLLKMRQETVERLWTITESLNILYRANWTRVAEEELARFSDRIIVSAREHDQASASASRDSKATQSHQWSFCGSFLYSLTVITTIGYGSVAPDTGLGKIITILYALLGIPLMLLYLSSVGDLLSRVLKWIWSKVCRCGRKKRKNPNESLVRANHVPGTYSNLDPKKVGRNKG
ncbi:TWiK family of potassium channels protein 7 [Armadillidium nasatum]|uniref:TWiK family of potassium channels protein 7 n=1 Tax=Armadillidium nasatum TaxID=96803 RepID=A0A5N5T3Q8_9CRUS|nr:TWiK family of potassium channels protein 7 [Armadillidium nasatum]